MIAPVRIAVLDQNPRSLQERFLAILPQIRRQSAWALRGLRAEAREELAQEILANAFCAFTRLARRGKLASAYPTPLACFAIRQVRCGRRVGNRQNANDLFSLNARKARRLTILRLEQPDERSGIWNQLLVEDRHAGPAETAAARLDLTAWYETLPRRNRRIAKALAQGESTSGVARQFGLSPGRISQLRAWLRMHWEQFQGGTLAVGA
jgi:hypothetical protein